jgi:ABC-type lipoprotein release transport system permease subunit
VGIVVAMVAVIVVVVVVVVVVAVVVMNDSMDEQLENRCFSEMSFLTVDVSKQSSQNLNRKMLSR